MIGTINHENAVDTLARMPDGFIQLTVTEFRSEGVPKGPLTPVNFMASVEYTRSYRDDFAFMWLGRVQGKYKAVAVVKRLSKRR